MGHVVNYSTEKPRFKTPAGEIIGWNDKGVVRATGIRYARSERFKLPEAEPVATEPIDATSWAAASPQHFDPFIEKMLGSQGVSPDDIEESCQRLSITIPQQAKAGDNLPVMVWIHGGSYVVGRGDLPMSDACALVKEQNVIVVSITYRLGLLGFLGGDDNRTANLGLFDIIQALKWIKTNISSFGGNPEAVTLFGQSAGGDAIAHLMIAEGVQGLFKRVIIQSAPLGISKGRGKMIRYHLQQTAAIVKEQNIKRVLAKQKPILPIQRFGLKAAMPFGTQYGYAPLPTEKEAALAWKKVAKEYDVLIGLGNRETAFFMPVSPKLERWAHAPLIGNLLFTPLIRYTTEKIYGRAAAHFARRHAQAGGNAYLYRIYWGSKQLKQHGAHCTDLPLLFGDADTWHNRYIVKGIDWKEIERYGKEVRALWAQFARNGKLNINGSIADVLKYFKVS